MQTRLDEWHTLLEKVRRDPIPGGVRLQFPPPAPLAEIARLAGAEQACCAFFTFTITVHTQGVTVDVTAPADGQTMLDSVFGVAS